MYLSTVAQVRAAFYRLVGADPEDPGLVENDETENEVAYQMLTRGFHAAQRWMLTKGYGGWRADSSALSWSGSDATGGRYADLPTNFLRAFGNERMSALHVANGDRWGQEVTPRESEVRGDGYYIQGDRIYLLRGAMVPSPVYLSYHYRHPEWTSAMLDNAIDFPKEIRHLGVSEAAAIAANEGWFAGDEVMYAKINRSLAQDRQIAEDVARPTKQARKLRKVRPSGNNW